MAEAGCTHRQVTTYVFVDSNEPSGLWACADCGRKFAPVNVAAEQESKRYRWLREVAPDTVCAVAWREKAACEFESPDEAVDAAMTAAPAVGAA